MTTLHICPLHLSDVATSPWEIQKKVIFQHYYLYTSELFNYLRRKQIANSVNNLVSYSQYYVNTASM